MPPRNSASIEIARPPDDVFPWLVEPEKRLQQSLVRALQRLTELVEAGAN